MENPRCTVVQRGFSIQETPVRNRRQALCILA